MSYEQAVFQNFSRKFKYAQFCITFNYNIFDSDILLEPNRNVSSNNLTHLFLRSNLPAYLRRVFFPNEVHFSVKKKTRYKIQQNELIF